jgi:hypothetical protein
MPNNLIDRLRAAANAIDDTGDVELRKLLADAAKDIGEWAENSALMQQQINDRLPGEIAKRCSSWPKTLMAVSRLKTERNSALEEVEQLKAQNARIRSVIGRIIRLDIDWPEFEQVLNESMAQSLAEIQAQAVRKFGEEIGLFDSAYDDQEYIEVSRAALREHIDNLLANQPITNPPAISSELVDGASNSQFRCWSCRVTVTNSDVSEADGLCPHCDAEIFCDD